MILFPNGKINLGLSVLHKRTDGYHDIETIIYPAPVFDVLEFLPSQTFKLTVYGYKVTGRTEENIVYKTWKLLHDACQIEPVDVRLLKNIPPGSGLGGGSSDGVFFLKALNVFFRLALTKTLFHKYALQLGSDCPFFLKNSAALVQGRGEIVREAHVNLKGKFLVVVFPGIHIPTQEAYKKITPATTRMLPGEVTKLPVEQWPDKLHNDFEPYLFKLHPELKEIKNILYREGAIFASLTGSGSAFYGIFDKPIQLKHKFPGYFVRSGTLI
ncbi:MAG TPA: 4-(cytidine 5'-diphospho)-2-C-methyl-D-erythritol kinase [Bacteroidetes bacterium]|nr:MAG: 4-(cytidine 5'-diphospho)-2-C-methyl-D-erythritol kinase [Bacteroidota bacterium]RLD89804.1 MAG: 4-(cytidine 5'-diphospho)-2-C-methyl-D-erythritol kinase [Bacteroidota bacterium]HHL57653.1 4-(cytidine 5'-diphospho)-2-C-methyl-D-erythritol kinase [Bacteroidota bacterium]